VTAVGARDGDGRGRVGAAGGGGDDAIGYNGGNLGGGILRGLIPPHGARGTVAPYPDA
jgi:hypothetical protein